VRLEILGNNYLFYADQVVKQRRQHVIQLAFDFRPQTVSVLGLDLLRCQVNLELNLAFKLKIHRNEVVQRESLPQGLVQLQKVDHVYTVWLLEQEDFVNVAVHDFIVMGLTMQLRKVRVEV
jgi:hypothetical protein